MRQWEMVCPIAGAESYVFEMCKSMKAEGLAPLRKGCERLPSVSVWVLSAMARFRQLIATVDPFCHFGVPGRPDRKESGRGH